MLIVNEGIDAANAGETVVRRACRRPQTIPVHHPDGSAGQRSASRRPGHGVASNHATIYNVQHGRALHRTGACRAKPALRGLYGQIRATAMRLKNGSPGASLEAMRLLFEAGFQVKDLVLVPPGSNEQFSVEFLIGDQSLEGIILLRLTGFCYGTTTSYHIGISAICGRRFGTSSATPKICRNTAYRRLWWWHAAPPARTGRGE
jgi:hypothetical protein